MNVRKNPHDRKTELKTESNFGVGQTSFHKETLFPKRISKFIFSLVPNYTYRWRFHYIRNNNNLFSYHTLYETETIICR